MVKVGSIWTGSTMERFIVTRVEQKEGNTWVHYTKEGTDRNYNCLVDAFVSRFREELNSK